jgi:hypothetical protein
MSRGNSSLSCSFRLTALDQVSVVVSVAVREAALRPVRRALPYAGARPGDGKQPWPDRASAGAFCPHRRAEKRVLIDCHGNDLRA